jgi:hypothetical protein
VLVVGSYPPIRTPGAVAALDQVRRVVAAGGEPTVASPRPSAAHYEVAVSGLFAGHRLTNLKRVSGAGHLILCAERDLPIPTSFPVPALLPVVQRITLQQVRKAVRGFPRVTIVVADDLGVPAAIEAGLKAAAEDVRDERERYRDGAEPGVTVLGPDERTPREQVSDLVGKLARRGLGPAYPKVRSVGAAALRAVRSGRERRS